MSEWFKMHRANDCVPCNLMSCHTCVVKAKVRGLAAAKNKAAAATAMKGVSEGTCTLEHGRMLPAAQKCSLRRGRRTG